MKQMTRESWNFQIMLIAIYTKKVNEVYLRIIDNSCY